MSRRYETEATLDVRGEEVDLLVCALVEVEPSRSRGWTASVDGELSVLVGDAWVPAAESGASAASLVGAEDALLELALEDDSAACVEED